ncbi:MAG: UDP-N-acetylglucosamine--N-acetylmuramyl-(pentapeptide) pyrophosphoryl-undecaprenol N-acetylglucosamine transferase [Candidatus Sericytochromatia bacterium]|nr:UDP-N-acetylglucosamine--N-acetylmuramyl-(pentapeptide) pyrophosphoryl-undecaprenol N-acetylglucosamine transferase [Candidatus Tanganyikabacteria bacterium]
MILLAAGGTGGHLYPALAVAEALGDVAPGLPIHVVGTADHLEARVVPQFGLPFHAVPAAPFPRRPDGRALRFLREFPRGLVASHRLLAELKPRVVAGFGAYLTVAPLLAAARSGIPVVLHEANASPGMANRLLARWASKVLVAHAEATGHFAPRRAVVTGTPLRSTFVPAATPAGRDAARSRLGLLADDRLLVVTGGSLGARILNEAAIRHRESWLARPGWRLVHLTGPAQFAEAQASMPEGTHRGDWAGGPAWQDASGRRLLAPYCDAMADLLAASDLVISRSGATTVAELTVLGRPAVLVPLALNPDQAANAMAMARAGGAVVLAQEAVAAELGETVARLLDDEARRLDMGRGAMAIGYPDAARAVAEHLLALCASP